jgi:hypothetical protein
MKYGESSEILSVEQDDTDRFCGLKYTLGTVAALAMAGYGVTQTGIVDIQASREAINVRIGDDMNVPTPDESVSRAVDPASREDNGSRIQAYEQPDESLMYRTKPIAGEFSVECAIFEEGERSSVMDIETDESLNGYTPTWVKVTDAYDKNGDPVEGYVNISSDLLFMRGHVEPCSTAEHVRASLNR